MRTPTGKPTAIATTVATKIIAKVRMVSSHISKKPIAKRTTAQLATTFTLRLANHAMAITISRIIGQGV
ncbi:hypothetical protein D3C75_1152780 [compost metagenome]